MTSSSKRVLIACGGTGGHLAPGIALAQKLQARGHHCQLMISAKQVDQRLIQKYPQLHFQVLPAMPLARTHAQINPASLFQFTLSQIASLNFCSKVFRSFRPHAVVGFGGFTIVGAGLYASSHGIPLWLHEQNLRASRATRTLAPLATTVYLPPGSPSQGLPQRKINYLGLPLRADLQNPGRQEARQALGLPAQGPVLVVMGGSQGSGPLNDWARRSLPALQQAGIHLVCLTGLGKLHAEELPTPNAGPRAIFTPFSDRMELLYAAANLVVARAGAGTLAELIHFRTPSILIPYPLAADHHQDANAAYLAGLGGCQVIRESELPELLPATLRLLQSPAQLAQLKTNLEKIDEDDPALEMAIAIESLTEKRRSKHSSDLEEVFLTSLRRQHIDPAAIRLSFNEPLGPKTTFGIGGPARVYAEPTHEKQVAALMAIARRHHLPFFVLGRGSNLLVLDKGFRGLVIRLSHPHWQRLQALKHNRIKAYAGVRLKVLCAQACKEGLQGFEFMEGIPATLGGALHMNAGAFHSWMFDCVEKVCYLTAQGQLKVAAGHSLRPGYRHVPGLQHAVVLWATLAAPSQAPADQIKTAMERLATQRKASQPREASAGCVFKNPSDTVRAGHIIDQAGLKGFSIGGAQVSPVHANFIVNTGGATSNDVLALIHHIRHTVWTQKKILLEPEIMLLGGQWNDYLTSPAPAPAHE